MALPEHDQNLEAMVSAVRAFMRDHPALNRLTSKEETSPRLIAFCVMMALSEINATPPLTSWSLSVVPAYLMILSSVVTVLESVVLLKTRNKLQFSDGGVTISRENPELIASMISLFRSTLDRKLKDYKIARSIDDALTGGGGVFSELWWVNGSYLGW